MRTNLFVSLIHANHQRMVNARTQFTQHTHTQTHAHEPEEIEREKIFRFTKPIHTCTRPIEHTPEEKERIHRHLPWRRVRNERDGCIERDRSLVCEGIEWFLYLLQGSLMLKWTERRRRRTRRMGRSRSQSREGINGETKEEEKNILSSLFWIA